MKSAASSLLSCVAWLVLFSGIVSAQPAPPADGKADPVLGAWRLQDGRTLKFRENRSVGVWTEGVDGPVEGTWEKDPFAEALRRYQIKWNHGVVWDVEMAKDLSAVRTTRKEGEQNTGLRLEELAAYLRSDDTGGLSVNGIRVIGTPTTERLNRVFIRSGDVLAVTLQRAHGDIAFALEIFRGNTSVISADDFVYTAAPNPDWQKTKDTTGYREAGTLKLRDVAMGNVIAPLAATAKGGDVKYDRLYFKYVVP